MVRRVHRAIKGISPVLATLILIVIAVVAGLLVYGWVSGWIGRRLPTEEVRIDRIYYVNATTLRIIVINTGKTSVTIDHVWVINATGYAIDYSVTASLDPGSTKSIVLGGRGSANHNLSKGDTVTVRVRTTTGNTFEATLAVE